MKKIIFTLLFCLMMAGSCLAVDTADWSEITIQDHVFKIPPKYAGGKTNINSYQLGNWNNFAILCVDTYIVSNYGFEADNYGPGEDLTINGHPARYFNGYNKYEKTNLSRIYYPVGESIYCISWQSDNLTEDVEEIVATSDSSEISSEDFYSILDLALENYTLEEQAEKETYYPTYTTSQTSHGDHSFLKYYMFYRLGQYSRR